MNIDIKDIVILDEGVKYLVTSKAIYNDKTYYFLCGYDDSSKMLICYEDNGGLVDEIDNNILNELMPIFYETTKNELINLDLSKLEDKE